MKKLVIVFLVFVTFDALSQNKPGGATYSGSTRTSKKPAPKSSKTPATYPNANPSSKNVVYQYVDTTFPNSENHFPLTGNAGIGTNVPQAALEIRRNAGDTRKKNVLLQLSNDWSPNGQNEPSILFSNGDISSPSNVSYWTIGARVSGDNTLKTPQTFKVCHKPVGSNVEQEFFSIDSYQGRVKIGDVSTLFDGYKLFVEEGMDTVEANLHLGFKMDERDYGVGAQMLRYLNVSKLKLMSNNPKKRAAMKGYGLEIIETVSIEIAPNIHNERYLETKRDKMGHDILKH